MIANLRETTQKNAEQDWLNTNLARISGLMQGQRDLATVSRLIMSEISPLVTAQHGAFFLTRRPTTATSPSCGSIASYGYKKRKTVSNQLQVRRGARRPGGAGGQEHPHHQRAAGLRQGHVRASARRLPVNIIVMPILFEEQVLAVVELASLRAFSEVNQAFLEQLARDARRRAERDHRQPPHGGAARAVRSRSPRSCSRQSEELQSQQEELKRSNAELEQQTQSLRASEELLQTQQEELQQTNEELQEKAELLSQQNRDIEVQNAEIERARAGPRGEGRAARGQLEVQVASSWRT